MKKIKIRKPCLVEDWRDGWKWISSNCMLLAMSIEGAWMFVPDDMKRAIPENYVSALAITILIAGFLGRFIDQKGKK